MNYKDQFMKYNTKYIMLSKNNEKKLDCDETINVNIDSITKIDFFDNLNKKLNKNLILTNLKIYSEVKNNKYYTLKILINDSDYYEINKIINVGASAYILICVNKTDLSKKIVIKIEKKGRSIDSDLIILSKLISKNICPKIYVKSKELKINMDLESDSMKCLVMDYMD